MPTVFCLRLQERASFVPALTLARRPPSPSALACVPALTIKVSACFHTALTRYLAGGDPHLQGCLSRAQATLVFSSRHSTGLTGSVDVCLQVSRPERPLSGFSDGCRRVEGCRPPAHATRQGRANRRAQETENACRRCVVAVGRQHHAWPVAHSNFRSAKLHWIEVVTIQKTIKFGAVPPG